jgi:hypothetical protein
MRKLSQGGVMRARLCGFSKKAKASCNETGTDMERSTRYLFIALLEAHVVDQ